MNFETARRVSISPHIFRCALHHHFHIDRWAAILSHGNAEVNPVALAAGSLDRAVKGGARLYAPVEVLDPHRTAGGTRVCVDGGIDILAMHVVLCTGSELPKIVPTAGNQVFTTWDIATNRQPDALWLQNALIWEASEPYLYLRTTQDGRVVCGAA